ncbi:hypothetical protein B0T21DRAFT_98546 [Apiosordaria backusii]|uniref:Uncharacterized protein n=1 Tax=Apiosordaria backusii TaxID=314023 RepID=A0AA40ETC6_9PEZI|nr:hypothetical protein B0T21DRAFT_98546 [Apiosordaria backusii]
MLFPEEHENDLKTWIVKKIEKTPDADEVDAEVLADYVLALLKHDGDSETVRQACEASLPDFLGEGTKRFVNDILEAITYRSYLPNAPPRPPSKQFQATAVSFQPYLHQPPPQPMTGLSYDDDSNGLSYLQAQAANYQPPPPLTNGFGSRKRGYNDLDNPNQQGGLEAFNGRAVKQPRRGREDSGFRPGGAFQQQPPPPPGQPQPSSVGYLDPKYAAEFMFNMLQPEFMAAQQQQNKGGRKKKAPKCRDYVNKGVCPRGFNCKFDHSSDDVGFGEFPQVEEYDPANALMTNMFNQQASNLPGMPSFNMFDQTKQHNNSHRSKGQGGNRGGGGHQKRGGDRSVFSAEGPVLDRTKSTIVVESIPEENFDEDQVRDFFSQFGNILEVKMYPYKRLAVVKYDSWEAANAAYKSPKVIFENRFVKVFWFKDEEQIAPPAGSKGGKNGSATGAGEDGAENQPLTEEQLEEIKKRQEEAQKVYEEKMKKREELEKKQREIDERQKELLAAKEALKAKLAKKGQSSGEEGESSSATKQPMTQSEALRAQLAKLEEEARRIGIDPHADMEDGSESGQWGQPRGGFYGRGRGTWRGSFPPRARGFAPRGFRGGYRGRADVHAAYAAYSLDNRPKKVVVTGVDFTQSEKDELLRQYLFGVGEFTHINHTSRPPTTEISFKDRKTAEKFFNSVTLNGYTIPEIEGQVELAWASGSSSSTALSTPTANGFANVNGVTPNTSTRAEVQNGDGDGNGDGNGDGHGDHGDDSSDDRDVRILLDHQPPQQSRETDQDKEQNEMDYEVADDGEEQWY